MKMANDDLGFPSILKEVSSGTRWSNGLMWVLWLGFVGLQLWGILDPETQWATHYWVFIPLAYSVVILLVMALVIAMPIPLVKARMPVMRTSLMLIGGLYAGLGVVSFCFSLIATDMYGDGFTLLRQLQNGGLGTRSFSLWSAKNGIDTSLQLIHGLMQCYDLSPRQSFQLLSVGCGGLWLIVVFGFVNQMVKDFLLRVGFWIAFLTAGFTGVFRGDIEVYALPMLLHTLVFVWAVTVLYSRTLVRKVMLVLLFLVDFSFHSTAILFLPLVGQALLMGKEIWSAKGTRRFWWFGVILPGGVFFWWLYFFKLQSYRLPYVNFGAYDVFKTLFLPVIPDQAPFDRYTVWSWAHVLDYLNAFWHNGLFFFGLMVFLMGMHLVKRGRFVPKNALTLACFYTLVVVSSFYFFVNCTLGMARDWDMLGLPVLMTSLTIVVFCGQIEWDVLLSKHLFKGSLIVALATVPQFVVNQNSTWVNYRLVALSVQTWKGYHAGSYYMLNVALKNLKLAPQVEYKSRLGLMQKMQDLRWSKLDLGIADNAVRLGQLCHELKNESEAVNWFEVADEAFPHQFMIRKGLSAQYFFSGYYQKAYQLAAQLLVDGKRDLLLLDIAMLSAERMGEYGLALAYAERILAIDPHHSQALRLTRGMRAE